MVLVDAGATMTDEDLATLRTLAAAGVEAHILLSKADLLSESDRTKFIEYIAQQVRANLGMEVEILPVSSRSSHHELLDRWVAREIQPLFARHSERLRESLWKKTLALKQMIEASLRVRTQRLDRVTEEAGDIAELESALRKASAEIVLQRRECRGLCNALPDLKRRILESVAQKLAFKLEGGPSDVQVSEYLEAAVMESSNAIKDRLTTLAGILSNTLESVAKRLRLPPPNQEELAGCIREMPRSESPRAVLRVGRSTAMFGTRWAVKRIAGRLQKLIGNALSIALLAHARQLEVWSFSAIAKLEHQFEAHADVYRAQLGAIGSRQIGTGEEVEQLRQDLAMLEGWQLQPVEQAE
jgi:hypothetical protein